MVDRNENELERGDVLLISLGNYIGSGIFIKPGQSNNLNYYCISKYNLQKLNLGYKKLDYLATASDNRRRYVKIPKELLTLEEQDIYEQMIKLL